MTLDPVAIVTHDLHGHAQRPDVSSWRIFPSYRVIDEYGGHTRGDRWVVCGGERGYQSVFAGTVKYMSVQWHFLRKALR
jgi:hypothetical protein